MIPGKSPASLEPKNGLVCLLVNQKSGRCLSVANGAVNPGAKIVQGPTPDQAGAGERWTLLGSDKTFRLRNESSRLVLEIGSNNPNPGVQAIQWHDQVAKPSQLWTFEPAGDAYVLRVGHSQMVLAIGEGSLDAGALLYSGIISPTRSRNAGSCAPRRHLRHGLTGRRLPRRRAARGDGWRRD